MARTTARALLLALGAVMSALWALGSCAALLIGSTLGATGSNHVPWLAILSGISLAAVVPLGLLAAAAWCTFRKPVTL